MSEPVLQPTRLTKTEVMNACRGFAPLRRGMTTETNGLLLTPNPIDACHLSTARAHPDSLVSRSGSRTRLDHLGRKQISNGCGMNRVRLS